MRLIPEAMQTLWLGGGPFIGDIGAAHGRVTVEKNWTLTATSDLSAAGSTAKLPYRWWQRVDNSQVETEVPNIKTIEIDRSLDADAQSCNITMYNTTMNQNGTAGIPNQLGQPGAYTWNYGERDAAARWGQSASDWNNVLIPNALLRTYQGYGGRGKTISQALTDGNIMLTGVWLIDEVRVGTDGMLTIKCRDMMKLLLDQQMFPPLMPAGPNTYPVHYYRWKYNEFSSPAVGGYDQSNPVGSGPGNEGPKFIRDIAMSADGLGYYVVGTDGGVFAFGVPFYGSRGGDIVDNAPMAAIAADPLNHGYWLVAEDGGVFAFGQVGFYGAPTGIVTGIVTGMAPHPDGRGYWIVDIHGAVYAYGSSQYRGGSPVGITAITAIEATPNGNGYWLLDINGSVYAYGDAPYLGGLTNLGGNWATAINSTPAGDGYLIVTLDGGVHPFGAATTYASNGAFNIANVGDPIFEMAMTPTGHGYLLVAGNGGVYSFGDAPFWGSLLSPFVYTQKVNGNYLDYVDIIKDLVLWAGWLAFDGTNVNVYGTLESTGAYSEDEIDPTLFDKRPIIDAINGIKEIVGYYVWVDEEGAFHFESPNWYQYGNTLDTTNQRVESVYTVDEQYQLTDYMVSYTDVNVRSEIIISSSDPTAGLSDTVTTRQQVTSGLLRGMVKPAMLINGYLSKASEQQRMLEVLLDHINFSLRQGSVTCVANPAIQINDQIRIYERQTGETFIHYVKGIQSTMDLDTGEWTTVLTTFWLGEDWIIATEPALALPPGESTVIPGSTQIPGIPGSTVPPILTGPTPPTSTPGSSGTTTTLGPFTFDATGAGGTLYGPDTFPGTVGANLGPPWVLDIENSGTATLVAGGMKLQAIGSTAYYGRARVSLHTNYTDTIVTGDFTTMTPFSEHTVQVVARWNPDSDHGYHFGINPGANEVSITKFDEDGYLESPGLITVPFSFSPNTKYNFRVEVQGTNLRLWVGTGTFSGSYTATASANTIASGYVALFVNSGLVGGIPIYAIWNNIQISGFGSLAASPAPWVITAQGPGTGTVVNGALQLVSASDVGVDQYVFATLPTASVLDGAISGTLSMSDIIMHGPSIWFRNFGSYKTGPHGGYSMIIEPYMSRIGVAKRDGIAGADPHGAFSYVDTQPFTFVANQIYYFRFEVRGDALKAYLGTTPYTTSSTWNSQGVGGGLVPNPGNVELWNGDHGLGTGSPTIRFDNILIEEFSRTSTGGGGGAIPPTGVVKLGAYSGNDPSSPDHFGELIDADAPCGGTFQDLTTDPNPLLINAYKPWLHARTDRLLVITVEPTLGFGHDDFYVDQASQLASNIQAAGIANQTVIRFMHECNGSWYPWTAQIAGNSAGELYKVLFRRVVLAMRANAPDLRFAWNTQPGNAGTGQRGGPNLTADPELFYPGDDVVDIVTLSAYLWAFSTADHSAEMVSRWTWARDFAIAHGKHWAADEWACVATSSANHGDGDNPTSLIATLNFMRDNGCVYSWYFNVPDGNVDTTLDQLPNCRSAFHNFAQTLL